MIIIYFLICFGTFYMIIKHCYRKSNYKMSCGNSPYLIIYHIIYNCTGSKAQAAESLCS